MESIRRVLLASIFCCFCAAALLFAPPENAYANGKPAVTSADEASAEAKARQEKLEAEKAAKAARERREAEARKQEAARQAAAKKAAADKAAQAARQAVSDEITARANAWMQGRSLVEEGRFRTAAEYLQRFVKTNPRSADAWYWLSRAHHALGDYDRAQWAANIVLEIDAYYPGLTKTPSGMQPLPRPVPERRKEPRPSMSVMPVKPSAPSAIALEPTTLTLPYLEPHSGDKALSDDAGRMAYLDPSRVPEDAEGAYQEAHLRYEAYPPLPRGRTAAWMQRESFQEISRWRFRVDRMAIVKEPRIAVAWKGSYPYEVYFWTGLEWTRISSENKPPIASRTEKIDEILFRVKDDIEEVLAQHGYAWREADTPALASNAAQMRYWWQGEIDLSGARRAKEEAEVRRKKAEAESRAEEDARRSAGK